MIDDKTIIIEAFTSKEMRQISAAVTSIRVSYSIDGASQVTVDLVDKNMEMWNNNYFMIKQVVIFKGERFMIASNEISAGDGDYAKITIELRTEAVQLMRLDKKPEAFKSTNGFDFAKKVAAKFKLGFIGQNPAGIKSSTIKLNQSKTKESVYDVLLRAAKDLQYVCFVMEAYTSETNKTKKPTLFFGSPQWLLGRWGLEETPAYTFQKYGGGTETRTLKYIPLKYPNDEKLNYFLTSMPNMRRSMDSPKESEGRASLWGGSGFETGTGNAYDIRPGMTVMIYGIKTFETAYLVTSVEYSYAEPEPVQIAFATIAKIAPDDKKKIDSKANG
jgi:hypothetical protein